MGEGKLQKLLDKALQMRLCKQFRNSFDQQYSLVYKAFEVPLSIRKVVHQISPIGYEKAASTLWPPCAIPLWVTLSGIVVCEWKHWFAERKSVIVRYYPEYGMAVEWARNYKQLGYLILQNILTSEAEMCPEVVEVGKCLGIEDIDDVYKLWESFGDRPVGFAKHNLFYSDLPQSCFENDLSIYSGDFPTVDSISEEQLKKTCLFELHGLFKDGIPVIDIRQQVSSSDISPPWLKGKKMNDVFKQLLKQGDLAGSWMTLCSKGWKYEDAKEALLELAQRTDNLRLKILAECWCSLPFKKDDNY